MSTMPAELIRMIAGAIDSNSSSEDIKTPASANTPDNLNQAFGTLTEVRRFNPGDLVAWKKLPSGGSLKNRKNPQLHETAIVLEHFNEPLIIVEDDAGSPYFREPLDLVVGYVDKDGNFVILHVDSRRFEAANSPSTELAELRERLLCRQIFTPGMLVTWKPGLRNRVLPLPGQPVVVERTLEGAIHDAKTRSGSPYFREPFDLICGLLDADGEYAAYHYDSRRFMPYVLPEAAVTEGAVTRGNAKPKRRQRNVIA
ncbi:hypothetical protein [Candidatus Symbiobacter mobilis]|uniref:Uncharacterized protein n=1 Tax=Candidatus Symbiobacter mobilis CR TaxID=946483 RepID=U5NBN1_9BURK|nr:hypothetical protein [Candidatus Symbiobacter mobilis]AGX88725.1 hypothetical protein Cenrod_2675 [Candidatus Symbiobacter mobilis CR]